jgi:hypothetical protein
VIKKGFQKPSGKEAPELLRQEENCNGEGGTPLLEKMHSFDDLARELAAGSISRRRAIKLTGGALLGTALLAFSSSPAEARRRRRNPCRRKRTSCESTPTLLDTCRGNPNCHCFRTAAGGKQCVDISGETCPTTNECDSAEDCPGPNEICVLAPGCCGTTANRICMRRCPRG